MYIPSILSLLGIYTTAIPASLIALNGSSASPALLCPEAIIISGSNPTIVSASGDLKSKDSISLFNPSNSAEYLSTPTSLSLKPNPSNTSVLDGAVDTILSIFVGIVTSFPSLSVTFVSLLLLHPTVKINNKLVINAKNLFFTFFSSYYFFA